MRHEALVSANAYDLIVGLFVWGLIAVAVLGFTALVVWLMED